MTPKLTLDPEYMEKYRGAEWMETFTGVQFYPLAPRVEDMNIFDIAHALAYKCRYNGHVKKFLSVAEHCVTLAMYARHVNLPLHVQYQLLMHDGCEAYLPDIPRPIKHMFPDLIHLEKVMDGVVRDWAGLSHDLPPILKEFDSRVVRDEREQGMHESTNSWKTDGLEKLGVELSFWDPDTAYVYFLQTYQLLSCEYHGEPTLLVYDEGDFGAGFRDGPIKLPDIRLIDLRGRCALAIVDEKPKFIHGNFDFQSRR